MCPDDKSHKGEESPRGRQQAQQVFFKTVQVRAARRLSTVWGEKAAGPGRPVPLLLDPKEMGSRGQAGKAEEPKVESQGW